MPAPAVSPTNWQRTTIIAHFVTATPIEIVAGLSFQDRLLTILNHDKNFVSRAKENEQGNTASDYKTHSDFHGQWSRPYVRRFAVERDTPHRPSVDSDVIDKLRAKARTERPGMPVEKLDFDDTLGIVLDAAERYYRTLQCEMREKTAAEGER